jgi:hypothetical protein
MRPLLRTKSSYNSVLANPILAKPILAVIVRGLILSSVAAMNGCARASDVPPTAFITCSDGTTRPWPEAEKTPTQATAHLNMDGKGAAPLATAAPDALSMRLACAVPAKQAWETHRKNQLAKAKKDRDAKVNALLHGRLFEPKDPPDKKKHYCCAKP